MLFPLLAALAAAAAAPVYPGTPPDLAEAAIAFDRAQAAGDAAALNRLVADDYVLVNSRGQREAKAQFVAEASGPGAIGPFTIEDQVILVTGDTAVLGGVVALGGTRLRFADVWARRGGRWQVVFTDATKAP